MFQVVQCLRKCGFAGGEQVPPAVLGLNFYTISLYTFDTAKISTNKSFSFDKIESNLVFMSIKEEVKWRDLPSV